LSTTTTAKRHWKEALEDARAMKALFPASTWSRWELAGSIRRRKVECSDVDYVLVPRFGEIPGDDLYSSPKTVNLFWHRLDELVAAGTLEKAVARVDERTAKPVYCWGEVKRVVSFRGYAHEFYVAEPSNYGAVVAVRTGPGGYSKMLVTVLQQQGYCCSDGFHVFNKRDLSCPCGWRGTEPKYVEEPIPGDEPALQGGKGKWWVCRVCGRGAGLKMAAVPVPEEVDFLRLCGVRIEPPEARQDPPVRTFYGGGGR
jgi:hypothetical protein